VYWRYGDYVGVGPGAHGRFTRDGKKISSAQRHKPESWIEAVKEKGHGSVEDTILDPQTCAEELLMMGLRLTEGVQLLRLEQIAARPWRDLINQSSLNDLVEEGLLELSGDYLKASPKGFLVLNALTGALLS
jgi:oxygen-independent coproporphyrinogen-3 oxidase